MWKKQEKKDARKYEGIRDHNGDEILANTGENIEIYGVWGTEITDWEVVVSG